MAGLALRQLLHPNSAHLTLALAVAATVLGAAVAALEYLRWEQAAVIGVGAAIWTLSIAQYRPTRNRRATRPVAHRKRAALALVPLVVLLSLAHLVLPTRD